MHGLYQLVWTLTNRFAHSAFISSGTLTLTSDTSTSIQAWSKVIRFCPVSTPSTPTHLHCGLVRTEYLPTDSHTVPSYPVGHWHWPLTHWPPFRHGLRQSGSARKTRRNELFSQFIHIGFLEQDTVTTVKVFINVQVGKLNVSKWVTRWKRIWIYSYCNLRLMCRSDVNSGTGYINSNLCLLLHFQNKHINIHLMDPWISSSGLVWLNNLVKLCFSSPKITHLFRQFRPPTEDFLSNAPTQPPHSRGMRIFSHPQSAQWVFVVVAACRTRDLNQYTPSSRLRTLDKKQSNTYWLGEFGIKIARHRNHLHSRCKDNGITPTSLKIRCHPAVRARNIIEKAKELSTCALRVVSNKSSL